MTDRFDCQVMMGVFSYVYYWAYVSRPEVTVPDVLQSAMKLGDAQQVELFVKLGNLLAGEGILPGGDGVAAGAGGAGEVCVQDLCCACAACSMLGVVRQQAVRHCNILHCCNLQMRV